MNKLMMTAAVVVTAASAFAGKVVLDGEIPSSQGTVTGVNKEYKANAKVTLKATAKKGYVFTGWSVDEELNEDSRSTTVTFKTPESFGADDTINVSASFKKVAEVTEPAPTLDPEASIEEGLFSVGGEVFPTVTVKGLPSGMKFDAKKIAFTGEPSKLGLYTVTVSAKNSLGYVAEQVYTLLSGEPTEASVGDEFETKELGYASEYKSITASGLPAGVKLVKVTKDEFGEKLDDAVWYLQGSFTKAGQYATTIKWTYKDSDYDPEVEERLYIVSNKDDDEIFTDFIDALTGEGSREVGESLSTEKSDFALDEDGLGVKSISVSGLPTGITLKKGDAIKSADGKKTLGYEYYLEGMFTKIGEFNVVFTANKVVEDDSGKKKNVTAKQYATITVGSAESVNITFEYGANKQIREYVGGVETWAEASSNCTVTGAGVYTPVQKVTLTAKPAKNYLINGWYKSADEGAFSYKNAFSDVAVTVGNYIDRGAFVAFICATNDIAKAAPEVRRSSFGKFFFNDDVLDPADEFDDDDYICVTVSAPAEIKSVTFKGVPSGLKVTNKDGQYFITVSNAKQLKPGTYLVTALVKTALNTKGVEVDVCTIKVNNLVDDNEYVTPRSIEIDGNNALLYVNKAMAKVDVTEWVSDPVLFAFSASGLPSGLKLVKTTDKETKQITYTIEGTPKKAGATTVTYTAKAGGKTYTATEQIVVADSPMLHAEIDPAKSGTVDGAEKRYDLGSTVKLTAKPAAGYVFDGWYRSGKKVAQELTLSTKVTEDDLGHDTTITAKFVSLEKAETFGIKANFESNSGIAGWSNTSVSTNVAGVAYKMNIGITSAGAVTVTASGLPTGLKLVKDEWGFYSVEGVPTKAGSFKTKFVLKSAGAQLTQYVNYEILPLPTWAAASFDPAWGYVFLTNTVKGAESPFLYEDADLTVKIDAKGALTGSLVTYKYVESKDDYVKDKTIAIKAAAATSVTIVTMEEEGPVAPYIGCVCYSNLEVKVGKDVYTFDLVIEGESLDTPCVNWVKGAALWGTISATIHAPTAWDLHPEALELPEDGVAYAYIDVMNKKTGYDFTAKNIAEVKKLLGENEMLKEVIPEFKVVSIDAAGLVKYSYKSSEGEDGSKAKTVSDYFWLYPEEDDEGNFPVSADATVLTGWADFFVKGEEKEFVIEAEIGVDEEDKSYVDVSVEEYVYPE